MTPKERQEALRKRQEELFQKMKREGKTLYQNPDKYVPAAQSDIRPRLNRASELRAWVAWATPDKKQNKA